jgi:hypothetical protein
MRALGRARASGDLEGLIKVIAHKDSDEILGVHMFAARAADMIMEAVALMEFQSIGRRHGEDLSSTSDLYRSEFVKQHWMQLKSAHYIYSTLPPALEGTKKIQPIEGGIDEVREVVRQVFDK